MIKKIALVLTSSAISEAQAQQIARHITQRYGCEVVYGPECFQSASVQQRAAVLLQYLCDDSIDLLWSVRGGEGSADVLPLLAPELPRVAQHKPKYLLGLSDFTAVLVYLSQQLNWPCLHGPGALQLVIDWLDPSSWQVLEQWVSTETLPQLDLKPLNASACTPQTLTAQCTGGNLSLLNISIGDIWQVETQDKIVCLEDWHEKGYVVERTLKYFQRIGLFDGVKAVILGDFACGRLAADDAQNQTQLAYLDKVLARFAASLPIPVLQTAHIGHGSANRIVPYITPMTLHLGAEFCHLSP